jgi:hypothetical protein
MYTRSHFGNTMLAVCALLSKFKNKYMRKLTMVAITLLALASCTNNQRARNFGGTETVKLEPNEKFINITWKQDNLWIIVQDTVTGTFYAREKSSFGVMQGIIIEK